MNYYDEFMAHAKEVGQTLSRGKAGDRWRGLSDEVGRVANEVVDTNAPWMKMDPWDPGVGQSLLGSGMGAGGIGLITRQQAALGNMQSELAAMQKEVARGSGKGGHASIHTFDEYSLNNRGGGAGAQIYGDGIYTAQDLGAADELYRAQVARRAHLDPAETGHMYLTEYLRNPKDFVKYNTLMAEQPGSVLESLFSKRPELMEEAMRMQSKYGGDFQGKDFLRMHQESMPGIMDDLPFAQKTMRDNMNPDRRYLFDKERIAKARQMEARKDMLDIGIPGVKYRPPGSKLPAYVHYDPEKLKIVDRIDYGLDNPSLLQQNKILQYGDQTPY